MQIKRKRSLHRPLLLTKTLTLALLGAIFILLILSLRQTLEPLAPQRSPSSNSPEIQQALDYVRSFESLSRPLTFFHIPKTAGTAIEYAAGHKHRIPWGSCLFKHKPKRDTCRYPRGKDWPQYVGWWHLPRIFFPLAGVDPYQSAESFAIVRDPLDRMLSEFYYVCTLKVLDWRPDQCQRDRLKEPAYMNQWLQQKINGRESDGALAYLTDNGHFTPQYEFIVGPHQVRMIDYVLKLDDDLNGQFDRLMKAFHLEQLQLQKLNALGAAARDDSHLGVGDLSADTVKAIHQVYDKDFQLGYQRSFAVS